MKKYLASLTAIALIMGVIPVSAQNQAPPPPDQQNQGYGSYDRQNGPYDRQDQGYGPYDQQSGPDDQQNQGYGPYDQGDPQQGPPPNGGRYAPPPYNRQGAPPPPYNQQSAQPPYGQQGAPPYNRQAGPPTYNQQGGQPPYEDDQQSADQGDQPDASQPGVARISLMDGDVSLQHGDTGDWVATTVNTPVTTDDRVSTGDKARAELQLDYADVLRLSGSATAKIASISREGIQVQIGQGLVTYNVLKGGEANPEIDTPNATIRPHGEGEYRILVNSDAETELTVVRGSAEVSTPQGTTEVKQGQATTISGTDNAQLRTVSAPRKDDWDGWNEERNRRISTASSWGKTDRYYTGSEDLDQYGTWSEIPDYGQVWTPSQGGPDWTPYSDGRWVYEPYYGWTWVSYEPWGWAPYHYGRWFVHDANWVWWPGPVYGYPGYYPTWSPAYVSFFGWGGGGWGVGVGFGFGGGWGFGHVGWLPCGPGDWYHPWWGRGGGRFNTVSIANINNVHQGFRPLGPRGRGFSNVNEAFRNSRVRGGITSMDSSRFGHDSVRGRSAAMSEASFRQASMVNGKMPINPSRDSFNPSGRSANPSSFRHAPPSSQRFFSGNSRTGNGANSQASRSFGNPGNNARVGTYGGNRGGTFERPSQGVNNPSRGSFASPSSQGANSGPQNESRGSWQHFTPPSSASRGTSSNSYSRPPLNMRQPIVTQRGESGSGNSNSTRGYSAPNRNYSEPSRTYSAPTYNAPRGGYSAPRTYSAPTNSAPRGGYSAPSARPSYSAPASRPSYSAPRPTYSAPRSSGGGGGGGGSRVNSGGGGGGSHGNSSGGHSGGHH